MKKIYTAQVSVQGGREGRATSHHETLDVQLALPKPLGGTGKGTNPEELFAAGYAACFESALRFVASQKKISVGTSRVESEVNLFAKSEGGFALGVRLQVALPDLTPEIARNLVEDAHQVCPYSNAVRGNIEVHIDLL